MVQSLSQLQAEAARNPSSMMLSTPSRGSNRLLLDSYRAMLVTRCELHNTILFCPLFEAVLKVHCDLTIVAIDASEFDAHSALLAVACPRLLQHWSGSSSASSSVTRLSSPRASSPRTSSPRSSSASAKVLRANCSGPAVRAILQFCYAGSVAFGPAEALELASIAGPFEMNAFMSAVDQMLTKVELTTSNVVQILAQTYRPETNGIHNVFALRKSCLAFVCEHFCDVDLIHLVDLKARGDLLLALQRHLQSKK